VKIVETMDDENGLQTQIRRWHLTVERPMSDRIIPSNIAGKKTNKQTMEQTDKWPHSGILQKTKTFARFREHISSLAT